MTAVAVVIVCHELGRPLPEALHSVRTQTRPPSEILIADDGSSGLVTRQALAHAETAGVRVLRLDHRGVSATRNAGVSATTSPLVVMLDADDTLEPRYLEAAAAHLDAHPEYDFVTCGMRSSGAVENEWFPPAPTLVNVLSFGAPHIASMVRRTAFERVGGFDEQLHGFEDTDFWASLVASGGRGAVLPEILFNYRVRPDSLHARATRPDVHESAWTRIYRKHERALEPLCLDLVRSKEAFATEQREHLATVTRTHAALRERLAELERELAQTRRELDTLGLPAADFGDLQSGTPVSDRWGVDRGLPVDRYYIDRFIEMHGGDIRGRVLEVKDPGYTNRFGHADTVDVVDIDPANRAANIVADLCCADAIPSGTYDCVVLTQTLGLIENVQHALAHVARILKPGGTLLCTLPAAGRLSPEGTGIDGDYWRFTEASVRTLFAEHFALADFTVESHGNPLVGAAFLYGYAAGELPDGAYDADDPSFPLVYCVRAIRSSRVPAVRARRAQDVRTGAAILMYHRFTDGTGADDTTGTSIATLQSQLAALRDDGWEFVSLAELSLVMDAQLPRRVVALTVDDGYLDGPRLAQPVFREWGCPVTYFVVADALNGGARFWWDSFPQLVARLPVPLDLSVTIAGHAIALRGTSHQDIARGADRLRDLMHTVSAEETRHVLGLLRQCAEVPEPAADAVMTTADLLELCREPGVSVGSHSLDHSWLPALSIDARRRQIIDSRTQLEQAIGRRVHAFGYPYGGCDADTVRLVADAGYTVGVGTDHRVATPLDSRLLLPRIDAGHLDPSALVSALRRTS